MLRFVYRALRKTSHENGSARFGHGFDSTDETHLSSTITETIVNISQIKKIICSEVSISQV